MTNTYVLIDFENVQVKSLALLKGEGFHVRVFLGPNNNDLPRGLVLPIKEMKERGDYIELDTPGKNAFDFYITYYLGLFVAKDPQANFVIISKDKGFDSLIKHLKTKHVICSRYAAIEQIPGLKPKAPAPAAKAKAPSPPTKPNVPVAPAKTEVPVAKLQNSSLDELINVAVTDLIKREGSRPRTTSKLLSTIRAACGKQHSQSVIDSVCAAIVKQGLVRVDGSKVSAYNLPDA